MSEIDQSPPSVIVVERWRRYGHDRAYVRIDDADAGYRDLKTGELHCARAEWAAAVMQATDRLVQVPVVPEYAARHAATAPSAPSAPAAAPSVAKPPPPPQPSLLPDRDLALTAAGAAARSQAVALREEAPIHTFISRALGMKTEERAWRIGADAEQEVARRLARLDPRWRVLHAIPVGERGSDIDHLVIGPAGVFTINTKNHPNGSVWVCGDTFMLNGQHQSYVRNSRHEARRAASLLSQRAGFDVEVHGLIAVMGAEKGFTVKEQPADGRVTVMTRRAVAKHLGRLPVVLGEPSIDRIYSVARHLATWQPKTVRWDEW